MTSSTLRQSSYVVIADGCPMAVTTQGDDYVEINCGQARDEHFEFVLHREALRTLVGLGTEALRRMDSAPSTVTQNWLLVEWQLQ